MGWGRTRANDVDHAVDRGRHEFVEKTKLAIVVEDDQVESVVETIREHAHTGRPSDGKIFVSDVDDVVWVRTGEHGPEAI